VLNFRGGRPPAIYCVWSLAPAYPFVERASSRLVRLFAFAVLLLARLRLALPRVTRQGASGDFRFPELPVPS
jgi:hypothetical protein